MPEDRIEAGAAAARGRTGTSRDSRGGAPPLLEAKLAVAPLPGAVVARPRLHTLLENGSAGPVTVVSAPAGWGKTTLLSSWYRAQDEERSRAWLTLEPTDGGERLWTYLHAAVGGTASSEPPDVAAPRGSADRDFLDRLAAALARRPEPVTLVLDDFHQVDDPAVASGLDFLLRHSGDRLRLVIGGRTDPALALHRWRLSGELTEIRAAELAFTAAESAELLAAYGINLPVDQADELRVRTEGWPAGLRIATLTLPHHPDPVRFVDGFAGDDQGVADYLSEEVLAGLADEARDVLRRGAVAERVCGGLIDALTDRGDGEELLAALERDTGFVIALGTRPPAYRYHRMLADLLRAEQLRRPAEELLDLHRRAATWAARRNLPAEALRHALAAGEWGFATGVLVDRWPDLVPYAPAARPGVPAPPPPPPEAVRADPELALAYAVDRLDRTDPAAAADYLRLGERHEQLLSGSRRDRFALITAALRLAWAQVAGEVPEVLAAAARLRALAQPPGGAAGQATVDLPARAIARTAAGAAQLGAGDLVAAETELAGALADAERAGLARTVLACTSRLALVRAVRGELTVAERDARSAVATTGDPAGSAPVDHGHAYLALAVVALHRDRPADAEANLALAGSRVDQAREPAVAALAALVRAQLTRDRGDLPASYQLLLTGRAHLADQPRARRLAHWLLAAEADLCTAHGDLARSRELLLAPLDAAAGQAEPLAVALARAYLQGGDVAAAARTLPAWSGPAGESWLLPLRLEAGLLDALTARAAGDHRRAARTLEEVLALAEPDGFRRVFTRSEPPARDLLAAHLDSGTAYWPLLRELIAVGEEYAGRDGTGPRHPGGRDGDRRERGGRLTASVPGLGEPLTDRELTVLRYLQSILSNVEIASELSVSVNTVKTHVRNIYRKLDATRRREAVRRARELHLI
ncbi:LuxR family maltose regulon positive regulatory protein [Micromonospora pisi]|uniref:LuxR family maltose regulon positive regulatory protein n=1 Tax=Micromonospora pisi TaxID=589240 RepID=A0A495JET6_9ACTN|nr:LuxR C-terminal-related transcriptional regulator [Micromonospora pisi]RKR87520.1 LuxR family maltose regulon positive regulatory protein [Micromonospora pisi]